MSSTKKSQRKSVGVSKSKGKQNPPRRHKTGEFGGKFTPATNPPDTTASPWWPLVVSSIRKAGDYTFDSLVTDFLKQVGTGFTFNPTGYNTDKGSPFRILFRFERVAVWNLTGRIVSLSVWDVEERSDASTDTAQTDLLGGWVDCGGAACFPAVGYAYPSSHHRRVYRPDPRYSAVKILTTTGGSSDYLLHHLHIQWKADGLPKFSTVSSDVEQITASIDGLRSTLDKDGPSLGRKVINSVGPVLANYVIPLALGDSVPATAANIASIVGNTSGSPPPLPTDVSESGPLRSPCLSEESRLSVSYDDCS